MRFQLREGIVCRDIAGVYFAVDIHDKHFYRNKQINCLNEIAYTILTLMSERQTFTLDEIAVELEKKLSSESPIPHDKVLSDICAFVDSLEERRWVYAG